MLHLILLICHHSTVNLCVSSTFADDKNYLACYHLHTYSLLTVSGKNEVLSTQLMIDLHTYFWSEPRNVITTLYQTTKYEMTKLLRHELFF